MIQTLRLQTSYSKVKKNRNHQSIYTLFQVMSNRIVIRSAAVKQRDPIESEIHSNGVKSGFKSRAPTKAQSALSAILLRFNKQSKCPFAPNKSFVSHDAIPRKWPNTKINPNPTQNTPLKQKSVPHSRKHQLRAKTAEHRIQSPISLAADVKPAVGYAAGAGVVGAAAAAQHIIRTRTRSHLTSVKLQAPSAAA